MAIHLFKQCFVLSLVLAHIYAFPADDLEAVNVSGISKNKTPNETYHERCGYLTRECEAFPNCFCSMNGYWASCAEVCKGRGRSFLCQTEVNCKTVDGSPVYEEAGECNATCSSPIEVINGTAKRKAYMELRKTCDYRPKLGGRCLPDAPAKKFKICYQNIPEKRCQEEERKKKEQEREEERFNEHDRPINQNAEKNVSSNEGSNGDLTHGTSAALVFGVIAFVSSFAIIGVIVRQKQLRLRRHRRDDIERGFLETGRSSETETLQPLQPAVSRQSIPPNPDLPIEVVDDIDVDCN